MWRDQNRALWYAKLKDPLDPDQFSPYVIEPRILFSRDTSVSRVAADSNGDAHIVFDNIFPYSSGGLHDPLKFVAIGIVDVR